MQQFREAVEGAHMEMNPFLSALVRRWYLVLATLALTAGMTYVTVDRVGPEYSAQGNVLLFPPATTTDTSAAALPDNPYLSLGGLNPARDILIRALTARSAREAIKAQYPDVGYEMYPDVGGIGPILTVDVSGPTDTETMQALQTLLDDVGATLARLQSGLDIKPSAFITSTVLVADDRPQVVRKGQIRAAIAIGAVTVAIGLLALGLLDGLLISSRERRAARKSAQREDTDEAAAPPRPPDGPAKPPADLPRSGSSQAHQPSKHNSTRDNARGRTITGR